MSVYRVGPRRQTLPSPTIDPAYHALREQIEGILAEGRGHARRAGEWEKVETWWHVGDALLSHIGARPRAEYGRAVIVNLHQDIGLSQKLLWDLLRFRRGLPILVTYRQLGWSHIRDVLPLPTQEQRRYYLQRANDEGWSVRQLREALAADAFALQSTQPWAVPPDEPLGDTSSPLRARFGQLWTWRLRPDGRPGSRALVLDLGFHTTVAADLAGLPDPRPDLLVTSTRDEAGRHTFTPRPASTGRYTYLAWPTRIVDGDTLVADVDLGFGCQARDQRLRLRGIDCPELRTLAGRNARDFVRARLAGVEFVVIATHRTDTYGRYLADVRYLPGEADPEVVRTKGAYLNRELLDAHLARRYEPR